MRLSLNVKTYFALCFANFVFFMPIPEKVALGFQISAEAQV